MKINFLFVDNTGLQGISTIFDFHEFQTFKQFFKTGNLHELSHYKYDCLPPVWLHLTIRI